MDREQLLLDLIDKIYAAGYGEAGWDEVTRSLRDILGSSVVAIHADDSRSGESVVLSNPGLDPGEAARYEAYYVTTNVWLRRAAPVVHSGMLFHGEELISQAAFRRTEYYNDFARPNGIDRLLAVCLYHEPELSAFLSICKPPGSGSFSHRDVELTRALTPHLQRAAAASRMVQGLQAEKWLTEHALDALGRGAAVLDGRARVVFMNRRMGEIVAQNDGLSVRDGRVRFSRRFCQRTLDTILSREGVDATGGAFRVLRRSLRRDYEVAVTPLPPITGPPPDLGPIEKRGGWLVLVTDPERKPRTPLDELRRMHGLTEAEAKVAGHLVAGRTLREIGELRGTTHNTVKTQVRMVYRKIGVSNRAELVRRLSGLGHPNG